MFILSIDLYLCEKKILKCLKQVAHEKGSNNRIDLIPSIGADLHILNEAPPIKQRVSASLFKLYPSMEGD